MTMRISVRRRLKAVLLILVGALVLTLLSTVIEKTRPEVQDWDCPPLPASCERPVLVLGFPVSFISDYHGISPVGSASISGALIGEDHFHAGAFWIDIMVYAVLLALLAYASNAVRRKKLTDGKSSKRPLS